jgi:hypothetical protein
MKKNKKEQQTALPRDILPDAVGACRRDLAVYCNKFKKHNNKNSHCIRRKS